MHTLPSYFPGLEFRELTSDSRSVQPGDLFVAVRGHTHDGHQHVPTAMDRGARAVLFQEGCLDPQQVFKAEKTLHLAVQSTQRELGKIASEFWNHPSRALKVVGVTGTSGKTTTTFILEAILAQAGLRPGLLGTIENRILHLGKPLEGPHLHTTPGAIELQRMLSRMVDVGCRSVVMEVSSHALKQYRVEGVAFDVAAFTNLSPEHLDYHSTLEDYYASKKLLFTRWADEARKAGKTQACVVLSETDWGKRLASEVACTAVSIDQFHSQEGPGREIRGQMVLTGGLKVRVDSKLVGAFNIENMLVAMECAHALGISPENIEKAIQNLRGVPGRLERVDEPGSDSRSVTVLVDYAHKPDALEKVLKMLAKEGPVITVFGCGGDRDRTKRPKMGAIALSLSKDVWVTSDNPRTENPESIIEEIVAGMGSAGFHVESDRRRAIFAAIQSAKPGDTVLIAGKGHEDYQILGTEKIHFDDREVAREALALRG